MLKVAVIGLGRMGAQPSSRLKGKVPDGWLPLSHAEVIQSTDGLELISLCDTEEERLKYYGKYYNIHNIYTDYEKLIDEIKPDIISVATRTDVRSNIIRFAVSNGVKGIYAEKPFSRSIKECKETLDLITRSNVKIAYGATRRAMDIYQKAKEICLSGELGSIIHIGIEFGFTTLLWNLPHATDLISFFVDSSKLLNVQGNCELNIDVDIKFIDSDPKVKFGYFEFENGVYSSISPVPGLTIRIACEKGLVTVHGDGSFLEINTEGGIPFYFHKSQIINVPVIKSGTQYLFEELKEAVINDHSFKYIKAEEILTSQKMLFGIVQSTLNGGKIISPADIDENMIITGKSGNFYA